MPVKPLNTSHALTSVLPAPMEEVTKAPLKLDLQFFADDTDEDDEEEADGDDDTEDEDTDDEEDDIDLEALLKSNPKAKAKHEEMLKAQLDKRMKKFKGVDPSEYRRLKAERDKLDDKDQDDSDTSKVNEKVQKAETREKRAVAKEFAIDEGIDPVLFVKFINLKEIELDEDGEPLNLDELLEDLQGGKFAKYFAASTSDDDEQETSKKKKSFVPGQKTKIPSKNKVDPAERGRLMAERIYGKKKEE